MIWQRKNLTTVRNYEFNKKDLIHVVQCSLKSEVSSFVGNPVMRYNDMFKRINFVFSYKYQYNMCWIKNKLDIAMSGG